MPPIVLFDGVCGLCNAWVQFLLARDRHRIFRFAALQSQPGLRLLREHGVREADQASSVFLVDGTRVYQRSSAVIETLHRLGGIWQMARMAQLVPEHMRDLVYDFIAARRYRWCGRRDTCRVPTEAERGRFLADDL